MADEPNPTPTPAPVQGNDPAARTPTGEIKDHLSATPSTTEPKLDPSTATQAAKPADPKAAEKSEASVPDKYEFKAPEGYELNAKLVEEATPIFKELGLTQEAAQKLVDFYAKAAAEPERLMTEMRSGWRDEVIKNPALGDGKDNLKPEVRANISRAIENVGDAKAISAFKEAMDLTGVGDHPAIIAGLNALGKQLAEGTLVRGGAPSSAGQTAPNAPKPTAAQALYPNLPSSARS